MPDIKDTTGFFLDDTLDTEGSGYYEWEMNSGITPNKKILRVLDEKLETVNLQDPQNLKSGATIKLTTRGTEVSTTEYCGRYEANLYLITREFNTPQAERFNGKMDDINYPSNTFQNITVGQVIKYICDQTGGTLIYNNIPPIDDFAGQLSMRNVPAPQAIQQVLDIEGNMLWYVDFNDGKTVKIVNRNPAVNKVGQVGVNVVEQSITGRDIKAGRGVKVVDRDNKGLKKQYGGPSWVGRDDANPTIPTYNALPPLEMEVDMSQMNNNGFNNGITEYGYTAHVGTDGQSGWHVPKLAGKPVMREARLVQKGVMNPSGLTRNLTFIPKSFQSDLLTHPNLKYSFEAYTAGAPIFYQISTVEIGKAAAERAAIDAKINAAGAKITKDICPTAPSQKRAILFRVESGNFTRTDTTGTKTFVSMAIVAAFEPEWGFINGWVDLETGELVVDGGSLPNYSFLASCFGLGAQGSTQISWTYSVPDGGTIDNPIPYISVDIRKAIMEAKFRAHAVTVEPMPEVTVGTGPPWGMVKEDNYQKHNVIFNAHNVKGFVAPGATIKDDTQLMNDVAQNLFKQISNTGMAKGSITIFPGDLSLVIGQGANGGVITKIKNSFSPYFKTQFWLEGTPDIDNPEQKRWRKKIGEHEGLTQINSSQILENYNANQRASIPSGNINRISDHTHSDDKSGGNKLGDIEVSGLLIKGTSARGYPNIEAKIGGKLGVLDLRFVNGVGRLLSGDLTVIITNITSGGAVSARIYNDTELSAFAINIVLVANKIAAPSQIIENVAVGDIFPLFFKEDSNPNTPPETVISTASGGSLFIDHFNADESIDNSSTAVPGIDNLNNPHTGDLDDLFSVDNWTFEGDRLSIRMSEYKNEMSNIYDYAQIYNDAGDERIGLVSGWPIVDSETISDYQRGYLADILAFSRAFFPGLCLHSNARILHIDPNDNPWEGVLDFNSLNPSSPNYSSDTFWGAPIIFDGTLTGVEKGMWKIILEAAKNDEPDRGSSLTPPGSPPSGIWWDRTTSVVSDDDTYGYAREGRISDLFFVFPTANIYTLT